MNGLMVTMAMLTVAPAQWPMSAHAPAEVRQAHAAYLQGDWAAVARFVRAGLESSDGAVRDNLLELLDAAFEARRGVGMPVDWKVPEEFSRLKVSVKRREDPSTASLSYQLELSAEAKQGTVENIRIQRYPNQLVLDRQAGLGEWELTAGEPGRDELWAAAECAPTPPAEGLYLIWVKVAGKAEVQGWFALHDHASSASPYFLAPESGAETDGTPTFRWDDFKSPQYRRWESRALSVLVFDPAWTMVWSSWFEGAAAREVTVGKEGEGSKSLKPGSYQAVLRFQERRRFGDLVVARDSATALPFTVLGH